MLQKTLFFFHVLLLVAGLGMPFVLGATEVQQRDGDEEIIIRPNVGDPSGGPRQPSSTSIIAYYSSDLLSVCATLYNAGDVVDVELYNVTTGAFFDYEIPGSGSSVMPIGGTSGLWTVTFTLSNGDVYEGEFNLLNWQS